MSMADNASIACEACGGTALACVVQVPLWHGQQLVLVENVPAMVCQNCGEQFYEEHVATAIRRLAEGQVTGRPVVREIAVPVYRLDGLPGSAG